MSDASLRRRYYIARKGSQTYEIVMDCVTKIDAAWAERRKFAKRITRGLEPRPQIIYWGGERWGLATGDFDLPAPWKLKRARDGVMFWGPDVRTKEGRAINKEMKDPKYKVLQAREVGYEVGISLAFVGNILVSPGFIPVKDAFILQLVKEHDTPSDVERISDIEAEALIEQADKSKKKVTKKDPKKATKKPVKRKSPGGR